MSFLSPWGLAWLASIPVLIWIWRFTSSQRRTTVASLTPFERLLKRQPKRLTRLVVNALFWLQLAALLGGACALAQPVVWSRHGRTILALLDTSASMGAVSRGSTALERAKHALTLQAARVRPGDQLFIMATAPVGPLMPQPTGDAIALAGAIDAARLSHVGGSLATAAHVGRALLGTAPDETVVVTDEPIPEGGTGDGVRWVTVGAPLPNVAIVGLDAQGPLCTPAESRVVATIQNFSDEMRTVQVRVAHDRQPLAEIPVELPSRARQSVSLPIPETVDGWVEINLESRDDALPSDDHAWIAVQPQVQRSIFVRSETPAFVQTVSAWLAACPTLTWSTAAPAEPGRALLVTDQEAGWDEAAQAMVFSPTAQVKPVVSYWLVSAGHPVGSYLAPLELTAAPLNLSPESSTGFPVVSALVNGRKVPVVVAEERDGRRLVTMRFNPIGTGQSTPIVLAFFNGLRWLMGSSAAPGVGEPITVSPIAPGPVTVRRPDGSTETVSSSSGTLRYDRATVSGPYTFSQGASAVTVAVNAFDPLESNLIDRVSTWRAVPEAASTAAPRLPGPPAAGVKAGTRHPLAHLIIALMLIMLLIEWWRYSAKRS